MNPEGPDIVDFFYLVNPDLKISISTNGSARNHNFWQQLATTPAVVAFCLDGLEDTHYLYRQNTSWEKILQNAKTFINAGGHAVWKMIRFDHIKHQIVQCKALAMSMVFEDFQLVDQGRDTAPVFNQQGRLVHVMGNYTGERNFDILLHKKKNDQILLEDISTRRVPAKTISCETKNLKSIYISATGDVSPCCYTGFYPKTYGHGQYHQVANAQLIPLIAKNNALEYPLQDCIEWFKSVEKAWKIPNYEQGRLVICDDTCGQKQ
jgi:sulfatase maturation enzyme AslB (radical SAM superfamily)